MSNNDINNDDVSDNMSDDMNGDEINDDDCDANITSLKNINPNTKNIIMKNM